MKNTRPSSRPSRRLSLAAAVAAVLAGSPSAFAQSGAFTFSGDLGTGDSDALVGLSTDKTYLGAYNFGMGAGDISVNGVTFLGVPGPNPAVGGVFSTTGLPLDHAGLGAVPGGQLGLVTTGFVYGSGTTPEVFTYSNLTVGQTYVVSFYNKAYDTGLRNQTLTAGGASLGTLASYNQNTAPVVGSLNILRYTFQAATTTQTISFVAQVAANTNHQYGYTLEQTFNNTWTGGTNWTTSTWAGGAAVAPNSAGSNANFTAQGAPTTIDLDANRTVGHIQFDGANPWTISSAGGNTLTLQADVGGAATLSALSGAHTIAPNITLASPTLLKVGAGQITLNGNLTGGTSTLEVGGGTLTLGGTNTYTGETVIGSGTLEVKTVSDYGVPSAIGSRALSDENATITGVGLHFQGGTLKFTGTTAQSTNRNIRILNGANGATIDASGAAGATLSFTKTGANVNLFDTGGTRTLTLTGTNTGDNGFSILLNNQGSSPTSLTKSGPGTWVLNGPDGNGASGITSVTGGTLKLAKTAVLAVSGNLNIGTGAASALVQLGGTGGNQIVDTSVVTLAGSGANAGVLRLAGLSETIAGLSSAAGEGIVENESGVAGTSTLTLNVTGTQVFGGTLRDGDGVGTDGTLALTKSGAGTQTLSGANSYSGATILNGGVLAITNGSALGSTAAGTTQSGASELRISGGIAIGAEPISITGGGINNAGAIRNFADANTYAGTLTVAGQTRIIADSGSLTFNAATSVTAANQNLILSGAGDFIINGAITIGTGFVNKDSFISGGTGTLTLGGANTYTGATTVGAGTLIITGSPTGVSNHVVNGATLRLDYSTNNTSKIADTASLTLGNATVQLAGGSHSETVGSTVLTAGTVNTLTQTSGASVLNLNVVTVNTGATLDIGADNIASTENLNVNGLLPGLRRGNAWATNATNALDGLIIAYTGYSDVNRMGGVIPNNPLANVRIIEAGTPGNVTLTAAPDVINSLQVSASGGLTTIAPTVPANVISIGGEASGAIWHQATSGGLTIGTSVNDGVLTTGNTANATPATLTISNDSTTNAVTINSVVANNGSDVVSVVKNGLGLVTLAGNNTFIGTLTAAGAGAVVLSGNNSARPTGTQGSTTVLNGGVLQLQANAGNTTAGVSTALSSEQTALQPLVVNSGGTLQLRSDSPVTFAGAKNFGGLGTASITIDVNQLTGAGANNVLTLAPGGFSVSTTTINVTGGNGYSLALGPITSVGANTSTYNPTTASLTIASYTANITGAHVLALSGTSLGNSITGAVSNGTATTMGVTKLGTSTWTLNGADTYTGPIVVSGGTLNLAGAKTGAVGQITVSNLAGTNATLNISNGLFAAGGNAFFVGSAPTTPATGTVNQTGGSVTFTGGNELLIGNGAIANTGNYNLSAGSITTSASATRGIILGVNTSAIANFTLSGTGTLNMTAASGGGGDAVLQIGRYDSAADNTTSVFTQTGGTANVGILSIGGNAAVGIGLNSTLTLTGGIFSANGFPRLALGNTNTAVINIGGSADVTLPAFPTARGTSSTATINFDGGTLRPLVASTAYLGGLTNAFVKAGGAKLEVPTGRDITVTQRLLTDAVSTGGGLTKTGNGVLTLTGNNTFTGGATINAGTLNANADAALGAANGPVAINNNATLQAGGALTASARTLTLGTGGGTIDTNGNTVTLGAGSTVTGTTLNKVGAGKLVLSGTQTYATLNTTAGRTDLASALGTGTSTLNASAETNISVSQNLAALNIASGTVVTFGSPLPPAPAFVESLGGDFGGGSDLAGGATQAVPEPGSAALLLSGLATMLGLRRRR